MSMAVCSGYEHNFYCANSKEKGVEGRQVWMQNMCPVKLLIQF